MPESIGRREKILEYLFEEKNPITASALAKKFKVSRQIIVGDVALLRASGNNIFATPKGYTYKDGLDKNSSFGYVGLIACKHSEFNLIDELYTVVDYGGTIIDVTIEHSVYGQIHGALDINCRLDADDFAQKLKENKAKPLCDLTDGIHLHNIGCKNKDNFLMIYEALKEKGIALG